MHSRCTSREDAEFNFCITNFSDHIISSDRGFEFQNITDSSPLLPDDHQFSNFLPKTERQALIYESRRELMEMISNMPESCYELSLKDIVDEQNGQQEAASEENKVEDRSFHVHTEAQVRNNKRKIQKNLNLNKTGKLMRIGSLESETVQIKMFFPISSLSFNKKKKAVSRSKSTLSSSPKRSDQNRKCKDGWIVRLIVAGLNKSFFRKSQSKNNSKSSRRCADTDFVPGCSFLGRKK